MTQSENCPICSEPTDGHKAGYVLEGHQVVTCYSCWATITQITMEVKLRRRPEFLGRSGDPDKIRERLHRAVLEARRSGGQPPAAPPPGFEVNLEAPGGKDHDSRIR